MKVAFQIDELKKLNFAGDSSYQLIKSALNINLEVYFYHPNTLGLLNNEVIAHCYKITALNEELSIPILHTPAVQINLETMDIIWIRQDPPFDIAYITSTFLLEKLRDKVKIYNNPTAIRNSPEKLMVTQFSHLMPATLVSSNFEQINNFVKQHGMCVIKPLYGNAGGDVFFLNPSDFNYTSIIDYFLRTFKEQIMVQAFIKEVEHGDKRIILIDGEPVAYFNRIPAKNQIKSNLAAGGSAAPTQLTSKDLEICKAIKSKLQELDLFFVGIDVINGYLTEINVTSPTGIVSWLKISGKNLADEIWHKILTKS